MNRSVSLAFAIGLSLSACVSNTRDGSASAPPSEAVAEECRNPAGESAADDSSAPAGTALQLISISPPTGSRVKRSTVLVADLAYSVGDFAADQFIIGAEFDSSAEHRTTSGSFKTHPFLKSATGTYRLCFPLNDVWGGDVKRPLSVRFLIAHVDPSGRRHAVTKTEKLSYPVE